MSDMSFGLIMMLMGMGVTIITLIILTLIIRLMDKLFPHKEEK